MSNAKTVVALPIRVRSRGRAKSAKVLRIPARLYPTQVLPILGTSPYRRERSQAGLGLLLAFGFSAACWIALAAVIF